MIDWLIDWLISCLLTWQDTAPAGGFGDKQRETERAWDPPPPERRAGDFLLNWYYNDVQSDKMW